MLEGSPRARPASCSLGRPFPVIGDQVRVMATTRAQGESLRIRWMSCRSHCWYGLPYQGGSLAQRSVVKSSVTDKTRMIPEARDKARGGLIIAISLSASGETARSSRAVGEPHQKSAAP